MNRTDLTTRRRAVAIVYVVVSGVALASFAALAVDVGNLYSTQADLQRVADAAALAGASGYFSDAGLANDQSEQQTVIRGRVTSYALKNPSFRAGATQLDPADIRLGFHDLNNRHADLDTSTLNRWNAVEAKALRFPGGLNGGVSFAFARFFGMYEGGVSGKATAAIDDRFAGYRLEEDSPVPLIPFTIHTDLNEDMFTNGADDYSYDNGVLNSPDNIPEVLLYPWNTVVGSDPAENVETLDGAAGNFGLLDFAGGGAALISNQIANGLSPAELESEVGTTELTYVDDLGNDQSYMMSGEPGLKASIKATLESRLGDVIGYFIHDNVVDNGSNTTYRNVGLRFGRLMEVNLTGSFEQKRIVIQPVSYTGSGVTVSEYAPSTAGRIGRIVLVK